MAAISINDIRNVGDYAALYRWNVKFGRNAAPNLGTFDDLDILCESANVPQLTGASREVSIRGHKIKQPGIYSYSNQITLTFYENVESYVTKAIKQWRDRCWEMDTGKAHTTEEVSIDMTLTRLDNTNKAIWEYELYGVFLEDADYGGDLDATGEFVKPTMVLSYDYFKDEPK